MLHRMLRQAQSRVCHIAHYFGAKEIELGKRRAGWALAPSRRLDALGVKLELELITRSRRMRGGARIVRRARDDLFAEIRHVPLGADARAFGDEVTFQFGAHSGSSPDAAAEPRRHAFASRSVSPLSERPADLGNAGIGEVAL
jgi:hypothetical protein